MTEGTFWKRLYESKRGDGQVLRHLFDTFNLPVYSAMIKWSGDTKSAEQRTYDAFLFLLTDQALIMADAVRAWFRPALYAAACEIARRPDFDATNENCRKILLRNQTQDPEFDQLWLTNLLRVSMQHLREKSKAKETAAFEAFQHYVEGTAVDDIASRQSRSPDDVRKDLHSTKTSLGRLVRTLIKTYCSSRKELDSETQHLAKNFPQQGYTPTVVLQIQTEASSTTFASLLQQRFGRPQL